MSSPRILLREWRATDSIPELTALLHAGYADLGRRGYNFPGVDQTEEKTAERVGHGICLVAESGGSLVGTILVHGPFRWAPSAYLMRDDVAYFMSFAVHPDWRKYGVGAQLLAQAEAFATAAGYAHLSVDTATTTPEIIDYYIRRGYAPVEEMQWPGKNYRSLVLAKALPARADPQG